MIYKALLPVMMFVAGLISPAIAQDPHFHRPIDPKFHVFVDESNKSVNLLNVGWFVESGEILVSTATSRAPMVQFAWTEDDGTHHTLTTEASNAKEWVFEITSITGLEAFENGKIVPQGQGSTNSSCYTTSWVDVDGATQTVTTARTSTSVAGRKEELNNHIEQVKMMKSAFPPRPVTPPPDPAPEEAVFLYPPKWHRPEAQLELVSVGKWG